MAKDDNDSNTIDFIETAEKVSNLGSQLAAQRKVINHVCPVCLEDFKGIKRAVYCSNKCRQKNKRDNNK